VVGRFPSIASRGATGREAPAGCGLLVGQLEFYWDVHLRPRLDGLTDEEYFWEPVEGCWSLRPAADGSYRLDQQLPEPTPRR
jgi:hypothetical protein